MNRRDCLKSIPAVAGSSLFFPSILSAADDKFRLKYVLASTMYGDMKLSEILSQVPHTASEGLDVWCKPFGTQREEIDSMGVETFAGMLKNYDAKLLVMTCLPLGCFGLQKEMPVAKQLGAEVLVSYSPTIGEYGELDTKKAVKRLIAEMRPHADAAAEHGLKISIKNGPGQVISTPESILLFSELNRHKALGLALAPQYLRDDILRIPEMILQLGNDNLPLIYFQEYSDSVDYKLQKSIEKEQLPGRGVLSYNIVVKALKLIDFTGYAEVCMYTNPKGQPVDESVEQITELINESRIYVDSCVREL